MCFGFKVSKGEETVWSTVGCFPDKPTEACEDAGKCSSDVYDGLAPLQAIWDGSDDSRSSQFRKGILSVAFKPFNFIFALCDVSTELEKMDESNIAQYDIIICITNGVVKTRHGLHPRQGKLLR